MHRSEGGTGGDGAGLGSADTRDYCLRLLSTPRSGCYVGSLKSAMEAVFTPTKSVNTANQGLVGLVGGFCFFFSPSIAG